MGTRKERLKKEKLQDDMRRDLVTCPFCKMLQNWMGKDTCFNCGRKLI